MPTTLSPLGVVSYGNVTFGTLINSHVVATNIMDEAKRTVSYVANLLTVEAWVRAGEFAAGSGTDESLEALRIALLGPGQRLEYSGVGFGSVVVNPGGSTDRRDVLWGPSPKILEWSPLGANQTAKVKWQVEWHSPECTNALTAMGILAWNYEWAVTVNKGITTRVLSGYLQIPLTRHYTGTRALVDNADGYWETSLFPVPLGFRRDVNNRRLSKDRARLDFTLTDVELPSYNALPAGVVETDLRQSLRSRGNGVFLRWHMRISGSITVAPSMPPSFAYSKYLLILAERINWARARIPQMFPQSPGLGPKLRSMIVPREVDFEEEIFTNRSSFSQSFEIILAVPPSATGQPQGVNIRDMLYATGMWRAIQSTNWQEWHSSMDTDVQHPRGRARLQYDNRMDVLIDLCSQGSADTYQPVARPVSGYGNPNYSPCDPRNYGAWIWYQCQLKTQEKGGRVYHVPLAKDQKIVEQARHDGQYELVMTGYAIRIGMPTKRPEILSVNGQPVKRVGNPFIENKVVSRICNWPVYMTRWRIVYRIEFNSAGSKTAMLTTGADTYDPLMNPGGAPIGGDGLPIQMQP